MNFNTLEGLVSAFQKGITLYLFLFIRSVLEFSAVVWHSSLNQTNTCDIERIQKYALKVILKHKYKDYETALKELNLETLFKRREGLCLKFAKKSSKLSNFKKTFPIRKKSHPMKQRKGRKFLQKHANTERYLNNQYLICKDC